MNLAGTNAHKQLTIWYTQGHTIKESLETGDLDVYDKSFLVPKRTFILDSTLLCYV